MSEREHRQWTERIFIILLNKNILYALETTFLTIYYHTVTILPFFSPMGSPYPKKSLSQTAKTGRKIFLDQ
jgi:hypothetical protein